MAVFKKLGPLVHSFRPFQWLKNLSVFAAILFTGKLLDPDLVSKTILAFIIFCLLSSASYLINDIVDAPYDRLHPRKKYRPIAHGDLSQKTAAIAALFLIVLSFVLASPLNLGFLILMIAFLLRHLSYSFYLKKVVILDILAISFSFILRTLGGEMATGYHLPIWLMFTVVFLSLFIASGKRLSELVSTGRKTRPSLGGYTETLLNFYSSVFSVATLISYSLFAYLAEPPKFSHPRGVNFLVKNMPYLIGRKWLMITIFPIIFGIMRYSQLVFEKQRGERPEILLASDIPLLSVVVSWGLLLILVIYGL